MGLTTDLNGIRSELEAKEKRTCFRLVLEQERIEKMIDYSVVW